MSRRLIVALAPLSLVLLFTASCAAAESQRDHTLAEMLVKQGRQSPRVVACAACHRAGGGGDAASAFGNLTGLSPDYFAKQLRDYATGRRENRVMQVIAKNLTETEIVALAAYYADLKPTTIWENIPEAPEAGRRLAEHGDNSRDLISCNTCHGTAEARASSQSPNIFGQHPLYISKQLEAWQTGLRKNDPGSVMADIAKRLTPDDIGALAIYYARRPRR